jgi:hypothetical protein
MEDKNVVLAISEESVAATVSCRETPALGPFCSFLCRCPRSWKPSRREQLQDAEFFQSEAKDASSAPSLLHLLHRFRAVSPTPSSVSTLESGSPPLTTSG